MCQCNGSPRRTRRKEQGKIMAENVPNFIFKNMQIQQTPNRINRKRPASRHIIMKLSQDNLKSSKRGATHHVQGSPKDINSWYFIRYHGGQKAKVWHTQSTERKNCQSGVCIWQNYPAKMKEKLRYSQKNKSRGFITSNPALQDILKRALQAEMKRHGTVAQSTWRNKESKDNYIET